MQTQRTCTQLNLGCEQPFITQAYNRCSVRVHKQQSLRPRNGFKTPRKLSTCACRDLIHYFLGLMWGGRGAGVVVNGERGGVLFTVRDGLSWYLSALGDSFLPSTQNVFINPLPYSTEQWSDMVLCIREKPLLKKVIGRI